MYVIVVSLAAHCTISVPACLGQEKVFSGHTQPKPKGLWRTTTLQRLSVDHELWPRDHWRHATASFSSRVVYGDIGKARVELRTV